MSVFVISTNLSLLLFTEEKTAIGQISQSIDPVTDVITDHVDTTQKQEKDSVLPPSKPLSLDS